MVGNSHKHCRWLRGKAAYKRMQQKLEKKAQLMREVEEQGRVLSAVTSTSPFYSPSTTLSLS
jgi:hypothetical protein